MVADLVHLLILFELLDNKRKLTLNLHYIKVAAVNGTCYWTLILECSYLERISLLFNITVLFTIYPVHSHIHLLGHPSTDASVTGWYSQTSLQWQSVALECGITWAHYCKLSSVRANGMRALRTVSDSRQQPRLSATCGAMCPRKWTRADGTRQLGTVAMGDMCMLRQSMRQVALTAQDAHTKSSMSSWCHWVCRFYDLLFFICVCIPAPCKGTTVCISEWQSTGTEECKVCRLRA